ncbi:hypothetical protein VN97_g10437 [Penicillium thymicola]|uniref:Uncharacterized protein n=1 Tax=Penicillium thymicola TaxID=293382 RepID=A0AAI9T902_PENTH|nr:hypothetical protein VN97_g10437 [Penicillium thymicola]
MEDIITILPPVYSVLRANYNTYPGEGAVQSRDDMLHSTLATREDSYFLFFFFFFFFFEHIPNHVRLTHSNP